ncbi:uncharacterized protein LOC6728806 [Drosophila simulans]|uniref:uncharacterized protein LOC6728806 n=1 Tax=Drosophila simulans TaxID=7240 RepID=UPI00078AEAE9|nr:uncharacterized protein LOC6728806 [Drosophila simulans]XP_044779292.1 uncharacterized protein LOC6728806 [Drosophila simulans]KMZ04715.1 uncharacterized protein Dsimw501_GD18706, isoform B [Drosophila simulans]
MVVTIVTSPHKKTGRVVPPKSTPVADKSRSVSTLLSTDKRKGPMSVGIKRAAAGALTSLSGPIAAGPVSLGLVTGTDRNGIPQHIAASKAQATATRPAAPIPPPRSYRRAGTSGAAASASARLAAKVPGAPVVGLDLQTGSSNVNQPPSVTKKSSLSSRKLGGGKATDSSITRRVKFSANVHTFPSLTNTKKSTRIGELQLKKKVKKLKRIRSRREGGSGETARDLLNSSGIAASNLDIYKNGAIVDVEPPEPPRVLRLNVVGKSSPATGKSALVTALRRKAKRTAEQEEKSAESVATKGSRTGKPKTKTIRKSGGSSAKTLLASSSHLVDSSAGLVGRKKPAATAATVSQRNSQIQKQNGRRGYGKV